MRDANVASTPGIAQGCCSNSGLGTDVWVDAGNIVSHDAINSRGSSHSARQRRTYILRIIFGANPISSHWDSHRKARQSPCLLQQSSRKRSAARNRTAISRYNRPVPRDRLLGAGRVWPNLAAISKRPSIPWLVESPPKRQSLPPPRFIYAPTIPLNHYSVWIGRGPEVPQCQSQLFTCQPRSLTLKWHVYLWLCLVY